ncbi:MAG TPA: glucodextranase DOMON-like domain-containing protein [Thermoanaerobaculaceae bacterium]|nr:glucodextranase DOMON-like domain-containing protein [Thermoanaerobaculaceae bacterium]
MRTRPFLTWSLAIAVSIAVCGIAAAASDSPIFTLADPRGDDHGDGTLIYPQRDDLDVGELDILTFSAYADRAGTIFELTFAKPVRKPERRTIDEIGTTLDGVARLGFYNFNVDIYIDTDRVPGSGSTTTFPGRKVTIDPAFAWEKAICLTPRPTAAREALAAIYVRDQKKEFKQREGRVTAEDEKQIAAGVARDIASDVFFPSLVWVTGNRIRFLVPASFLGGVAKATWGYVVFDTVADMQERVDVTAVMGGEGRTPALMVVPVQPGRGPDFIGGGREDDPFEPPLIDLIVPPGMKQETILLDYDTRVDRMVRLPGVVPAALSGVPK